MTDRSNRKQAIFTHASALFMEKGYAGSSMRDLADRVGIEPSSLYSHIKSKEEILSKICLDTASAFIAGMDFLTLHSDDPIEQIKMVIDLHIKIAKENQSSVTVFTNEWRHLTEEMLTVFEDQRRSYQKRFKAILQNGIDKEIFAPIDASIAMKTILTSLRWVHFWKAPDRALNYELAAKEIKHLVLRGLIK